MTSYQSVASALEAQCAHATADDEILLFGSFYCVAEALEWLARRTDEASADKLRGMRGVRIVEDIASLTKRQLSRR